jgi:hypothetical protein
MEWWVRLHNQVPAGGQFITGRTLLEQRYCHSKKLKHIDIIPEYVNDNSWAVESAVKYTLVFTCLSRTPPSSCQQ